jgi:Ca2+-binding RTX toxin-like protein
MSTIADYLSQAELALAAYSQLTPNISGTQYLSALRDSGRGLAFDQASTFASRWRVVDQKNDSLSGLSATVFEEITTSKRYLAIRGTDDLIDVVTDVVNIGQIGTPVLQPQFWILRAQVRQWISEGTLPDSFNVTGHSLGGFLATGIAAEFSSHVEHAYLYDAPGLNGLLGSATAPILQVLGISFPVSAAKISNIKANAPISSLAVVGAQVGTPISINIENQLFSDVPNPPAARNHSQQVLTDSLAVYALIERLDSSLSVKAIGDVISAASAQNSRTLEATLDIFRKIFGSISTTPSENRDAFYSNLTALTQTINQGGYAETLQVRPLPSSATMLANAKLDDDEGLAYRYALKELNPFVLIGPESFYSPHNTNGELDLHNSTTGEGTLTETWLADRAAFLSWKNQKNTRDVADDGFIQRTDFGAESFLFTDRTLKNSAGQDYSVRALGGNNAQRTNPIQILFGNDASDQWTESQYADHLYGEGGDDLLAGGDGDDYLEGGQGNDRLAGDDGNDILIGGAGDDTLLAGSGSNRLEGGAGFDSYEIASDGLQVIIDTDGTGQLKRDGVVLNGGALVSPNRYLSADGSITYTFVENPVASATLQISGGITIQGFHDGDLGIHLDSGDSSGAPHAPGTFLVTDDDDPDDENDRIFSAVVSVIDAEIIVNIVDNLDVETGSGNDIVGVDGNHVYVDGGIGNDYLSAHPWATFVATTLIGGEGTDVIDGSAGDDQIFGETEIDIEAAIAEGATDPGSGALGDWLAGADGDDIIIAAAGNDVIFGGAGSNTLVGGAGDDHIYGDEHAVWAFVHDTSGYLHVPEGFHFQWTFETGSQYDERGQELPSDIIQLTVANEPSANVIYAGAGNDWVFSGAGDDYLDGGEGDDTLIGDDGINTILGGDGDDVITSGMRGGPSVGYLDGGNGNDVIIAVNGDDSATTRGYYIVGGVGDDRIQGSVGDDYVVAGDGNDEFLGYGGDDYVYGGAGDDYLQSYGSATHLFGGAGNDTLLANNSSYGTVLDGGAGDDLYEFFPSAGSVTISDSEGHNQIVLLQGEFIEEDWLVATSSIYLEWSGDELAVVSDEAGVRIVLSGSEVVPQIYVRHVTDFVDGRWIGDDELIALDTLSVQEAGSDQDDELTGIEGFGNVLSGLSGNDLITGDNGNDTLSGGSGDDVLDGGSGSDIYHFRFGDGRDIISEMDLSLSDVNVLRFGDGITTLDLSVFQTYDDLLLNVGAEDSGDSVTIAGAASQDVIARVEFFDGTVWDVATLRNMAVLISPPELELPVEPPPSTDGAGGVESDPQLAIETGGNAAPEPDSGSNNPGPVIVAPLFNDVPPRTVIANPFFPDSIFPSSEPEPSDASFGTFTSTLDSIGNSSSANAIGTGLAITPLSDLPSSMGTAGGAAGRSGSLLTAFTSGSRVDRTDQLAMRTRDAGAPASASESSNADGSPVPGDQPDVVTQVGRRDPSPGGLSWLAQQTDAPRDSAPALTPWAVANALMQFRLDGIDESTGGNASAGFINLVIPGLPGLSEIAPLGMGTPGLRGEGASLQSFSGLSEGLVALAA